MDNMVGKAFPFSPTERPKRPLTAYNFFFHDERQKLLEELPERRTPGSRKKGRGHGKIAFADMAKVISTKWRTISIERMIYYTNLANQDKFRYREQMHAFKQAQEEREQAVEVNEEIMALEPIEFFPVCATSGGTALSYADLASKLDKESIEFLISALK
eukprot:scaffold37376_cov229-Amphora_coffeaeformis.AAC.2